MEATAVNGASRLKAAISINKSSSFRARSRTRWDSLAFRGSYSSRVRIGSAVEEGRVASWPFMDMFAEALLKVWVMYCLYIGVSDWIMWLGEILFIDNRV